MKELSSTPLPRRLAAVALFALVAAATVARLSAAPTDPNSPVRLGSNENPFGFSPKAKEAILKYVESGNYYNRNDVDALVTALAAKEGVSPDYIHATAGSGPMLEMTAAALGKPGANIVTAAPGYPQLTMAFEKWGGTIKYVKVGGKMGYDFKAVSLAIDENTAAVYICNPNNPTGVLADTAELRKFILTAPQHVLIFVDEAYLELAKAPLATTTAAPLVKLRKNLIVSRTFSKAYGLAGFRIGYGIGHPDTLAKVAKHDIGASPSYLAAIAAREAVLDQATLQQNVKKYQEVRDYVLKEFDRMGLSYAEPSGAFILFKAGIDSAEFQKKMLDQKIMVQRPFGVGPLEQEYKDWVRVSIGTKEDMDLFLGATMKILGKT
ncbi:MAG TPA: histidinol-phosphate transaminase [Opitutaceae bacterium]